MTDTSKRGSGVPEVDEQDRRNFLRVLGAAGAVGAASELELSELRGALAGESSEALAATGRAIRSDLTGALDADVLSASLSGVASSVERLPALRAAGLPAERGTAFREVAEPAWDAYDHLADVGLFESAERHLPAFTREHVRETAREVIRAEPLTAALADAGFGERERTALVVDVVNRDARLSEWVSTASLPADPEGYDPGDVAPLHQRALGGALLWIDELDQHLWQRRVLLTEEMVERGVWDVKLALGGAYLFVAAARDLAGRHELSDSELAAGLAAGSAAAIRGQERLEADVFRITDAERAPRGGA